MKSTEFTPINADIGVVDVMVSHVEYSITESGPSGRGSQRPKADQVGGLQTGQPIGQTEPRTRKEPSTDLDQGLVGDTFKYVSRVDARLMPVGSAVSFRQSSFLNYQRNDHLVIMHRVYDFDNIFFQDLFQGEQSNIL